MAFQRAHPLRRLNRREREDLEAVSGSRSAGALEVAHAKELLAVADGLSYRAAAESAGMQSRHAVAALVRRFNELGVDAIKVAHGGGPPVVYDDEKKERILAELAREPDREADGTATWSVKTLQRALRKKDKGFAHISVETVWRTLREAGKSWQKDRSWVDTGKVMRRRKRDGATVEVIDCDKTAKKN